MAAQPPSLTQQGGSAASAAPAGGVWAASRASAAAAAHRLPSQPPSFAQASTSSATSASGSQVYSLKNNETGTSYELVKTLRDCLMGKVKAAKVWLPGADGVLRDTGKVVAIKILLKSCIQSGTTMDCRPVQEDPMQEMAALRYLQGHPHVLELLDLMEDDEHVFEVMEFAGGGDMFSRVAEAPGGHLSEAEAQRYFYQLITGLHFMHSKGVVHRDLSLENALLAGDDVLKIIDMGLATELPVPDHSPIPRQRVGKTGYMSPEVYDRSEVQDGRLVDTWCTGIMLFIMLFGVPPYRVPCARSCRLFGFLQKGRLLDLVKHWGKDGNASVEAKDLVSRLLHPQAAQRLVCEDILAHPWLATYHAQHKAAVFADPDYDAVIQRLRQATILGQRAAAEATANPAHSPASGVLLPMEVPPTTSATAAAAAGTATAGPAAVASGTGVGGLHTAAAPGAVAATGPAPPSGLAPISIPVAEPHTSGVVNSEGEGEEDDVSFA